MTSSPPPPPHSPCSTTASSPKRVLAAGARDTLLDLASDPDSRLAGADRAMLRAMFLDQYLKGECRVCHASTGHIAYYIEDDLELVHIKGKNQDRDPVFMCPACQAIQQNRQCDHCYAEHIFDPAVPLEERPPGFYYSETCARDHMVAVQCLPDIDDDIDTRCIKCDARTWEDELVHDEYRDEYWCEDCMDSYGVARCNGKHCYKIGDFSFKHGYCGGCAKVMVFSDSESDEQEEEEEEEEQDGNQENQED